MKDMKKPRSVCFGALHGLLIFHEDERKLRKHPKIFQMAAAFLFMLTNIRLINNVGKIAL